VPAARSIPLLLASLATALLLAACGGGGDGGSSSDEAQINEAVNHALTSSDPAICTELATQRFIDAVYDGSADECKQDATDTSDNPDSVDISGIKVSGDSATVTKIVINGGPNDGQVLTAYLKKEDDQWKFDRVTTSGGPSAPNAAKTTDTGTTGTGTTTTPTTGDPAAELFFRTVHQTVIKKGLSEKIAQCIEDNLRGTITPEEISKIESGQRPPTLHKKATKAGAACGAKFGT
jgi:hypothetical protein